MRFNSCHYKSVELYKNDKIMAHLIYIGFTDNINPLIKAFQISDIICFYISDLVERKNENIGILSFSTNDGDTTRLSHLSYNIEFATTYRYLKYIFIICFTYNYYKYQEKNGLNNQVFSIVVYNEEYDNFIMSDDANFIMNDDD